MKVQPQASSLLSLLENKPQTEVSGQNMSPQRVAPATSSDDAAITQVGVEGERHPRNKIYQRFYNRSEFDRTDTNGDGALDAEELKARGRWTSGFVVGRGEDRVEHADKDGDGKISLAEAREQKKWEIQHRSELTNESSGTLRAVRENKEWLQDHREVAKKLTSHDDYLADHPNIAEALYKDRAWLANHPSAARDIYLHRDALANNSDRLKALYNHRQEIAKRFLEENN